MALEILNVSHAYDRASALKDVSMRAEAGRITCLLGASGCGKTTVLRLVAGLLPLQSGEIRLDGETLATPAFSPPPEARDIGIVFQEGALFPHMTVAQNIAYGLRKGADGPAIVNDLLGQVGLAGYGPRYPHTLSGGQQQRIALARALAPQPRAILLDEPFASIDIVLRRSLREEMARLLADRGCVSVLVTHDPEEAIEIADQVVVMSGGEVAGQGSPAGLYDLPPNLVVGELIGEGTVLSAQLREDGVETAFGHWPRTCLSAQPPTSRRLALLVRRDAVTLSDDAEGAAIDSVRRVGPTKLVRLIAASGQRLDVIVDRDAPWLKGSCVSVTPIKGAVHAFPAKRDSSP